MRASSKRIAPLVEMVLVIFFFALLSAITLRMFASAYQQSRRSEALSVAVVLAQEIAEQFKAGNMPESADLTKVDQGGYYQIRYDKNFARVPSGGKYMLELYFYREPAKGGELNTGRVAVYEIARSEVLLELKIGDYQPQ